MVWLQKKRTANLQANEARQSLVGRVDRLARGRRKLEQSAQTGQLEWKVEGVLHAVDRKDGHKRDGRER
jgi:hypothetical protein